MLKRCLSVLIVSTGVMAAHSSLAGAAGPQGVTVSPAFQQVSIPAGETQHPVSFTITNDEPIAQTFDLSAADFNTLGESGGLFFVGTNPTALQKKYGLAEWFSLPQSSITLQPKQSQTIQAEILNLPGMAAGGHYGALLLSAETGQTAQAGNNISLHPIASSLMFVTKTGGDIHSLLLNSVSLDRSLFRLPSSLTLRFYNNGNTHVVPRGVIKLTTASGKLIAQGVINQDSNIILPQTYRQLYVPLTKFAGASAISKYDLKVDFRFDGISQYREYRSSFWRIDPGLPIGLAVTAGTGLILAYKRYRIGIKK